MGLPQIWGDVFGIPDSNSLANFMAPALAAGEPHVLGHGTEYAMAAAAAGTALAGTALAWHLYVRRPELPSRVAAAVPTFYRLLLDKYYVDKLYDVVIVRPMVQVSDKLLFRTIDAQLIDGLGVNGTGRLVRGFAANGLKYLQTGFTQSYVILMLIGTVAIIGYLLR